jgi:hypothetical protein
MVRHQSKHITRTSSGLPKAPFFDPVSSTVNGSFGHNSAVDNQTLGVRFGEITADGYR